MNAKQLDILRHALGWPENYRNRYVCGLGYPCYQDCEAMVKEGLMIRHAGNWVPEPCYIVTPKGKAAAEAGEVDKPTDKPLWEVMAAAHSHAIAGKANAGITDGYAAEIHALADEIQDRFSSEHDIVDWLRAEADRAEKGE